MLKQVTPEDIRLRFFNPRKTMDRALIARLTQLDYARDMALVAVNAANNAILGVVRLMGNANRENGEFAILIRSDHQHEGLGTALMRRLLSFAASEGYGRVHGAVLSENRKMLDLCRTLGFAMKSDTTPGVTLAEIALPASHE
jgi:acetyltransferase